MPYINAQELADLRYAANQYWRRLKWAREYMARKRREERKTRRFWRRNAS